MPGWGRAPNHPSLGLADTYTNVRLVSDRAVSITVGFDNLGHKAYPEYSFSHRHIYWRVKLYDLDLLPPR